MAPEITAAPGDCGKCQSKTRLNLCMVDKTITKDPHIKKDSQKLLPNSQGMSSLSKGS